MCAQESHMQQLQEVLSRFDMAESATTLLTLHALQRKDTRGGANQEIAARLPAETKKYYNRNSYQCEDCNKYLLAGQPLYKDAADYSQP